MSQIIKNLASGPVPPTVPTSFVTDSGTAVPAANILLVYGNDSIENNANGIITKGGVVGTGTANELDIIITNRIQGTTSTIGAVTSAMITYPLTVIGTYAIECRVGAYNTTSSIGAGYSIFGTARYDGVNANLVGTPDKITNEEGAMSAANVTMTIAGSNVLINGVGYAANTINWSGVALYTFVGV